MNCQPNIGRTSVPNDNRRRRGDTSIGERDVVVPRFEKNYIGRCMNNEKLTQVGKKHKKGNPLVEVMSMN